MVGAKNRSAEQLNKVTYFFVKNKKTNKVVSKSLVFTETIN